MIIYLAGGIKGNLFPLWRELMKIYIAGTMSRKWVIEEAVKLYLAGGNIGYKWSKDYDKEIINNKPYILESYYYLMNQIDYITRLMPFFKDFLLDSGAFTFMQNKSIKTDWDKYVEDYAAFINKYSIELFFELDIDSAVGIKEVERLREKLEKLTNKKCIPVWHRSRGKEYWLQMIKDYNYVAIGGIVSKEITNKDYPFFNWFLQTAKRENCKVHGLGFTGMNEVKKYPFYSVDSTAWLYGNRGGFLYHFNGSDIKKIQPKGMRLKGRAAALHNFTEWVKFSKYAERSL